jgi:hypothetical protein
VRVNLSGCRGLLSGWLVALTMPLLVHAHTIAASSAAGLGDRARVALATGEIFGAAFFAFERTAMAGFALLLMTFALAAAIHVRHGEMPYSLAAYAIVGAILLYLTQRRRSSVGPFPRDGRHPPTES